MNAKVYNIFILGIIVLSLVTSASGQSSDSLHWYRCNTHTHTGSYPASEVNGSARYAAEWYKKHGYQCLVITDHEHLTSVGEINRTVGRDGQFLAIRGEEISQAIVDKSAYFGSRAAHVNGINIDKVIYPIGFPTPPPSEDDLSEVYATYIPTEVSLAETYNMNIDKVYEADGIPQVNHPYGIIGPRIEDLLKIRRPFLFEVWNASPGIGPLGGTTDKGVTIPSFESLWDQLLSHGKTVWGVAADDAHDYLDLDNPNAQTPGHAWIVAQATELSLDAITNALRKGHFYASTGVTLKDYRTDATGIFLTIEANGPFLFRTQFIGRDGKVLAEVAGVSPHYTFRGDEAYVRASIVDSDGHRAWTQPVFRDGRPSEIR